MKDNYNADEVRLSSIWKRMNLMESKINLLLSNMKELFLSDGEKTLMNKWQENGKKSKPVSSNTDEHMCEYK